MPQNVSAIRDCSLTLRTVACSPASAVKSCGKPAQGRVVRQSPLQHTPLPRAAPHSPSSKAHPTPAVSPTAVPMPPTVHETSRRAWRSFAAGTNASAVDSDALPRNEKMTQML